MAKTFFNLLNGISSLQTLQYLLTLVDDTLQEDKARVDVFKVRLWQNTKIDYFGICYAEDARWHNLLFILPTVVGHHLYFPQIGLCEWQHSSLPVPIFEFCFM